MREFTKDPNAILRLSPEQYRVTQQSGTEVPGTGEYLDNKEPGIYVDTSSCGSTCSSASRRRHSTSSSPC